MPVEDLLEAVEKILQNKPLASIQSFVLYQSWLGKTYDEMSKTSGYGNHYIKEIGSQLWQDLSVALGKRVTKKNLHVVLRKHLQESPSSGKPATNNEKSFLFHSEQTRLITSVPTPDTLLQAKTSHQGNQIEQNLKRQCSLMVFSDAFSANEIDYPSGPVPLDSPLYIHRPPLEELICKEILHAGCLIRIKAPSKTGKSSLLNRMIAYAKEQDYQIVYLDFQEADEEVFSSLDKFLRWFCIYVSRQLNLLPCLDDFWDTDMGSKVSCKIYFEAYLLQYIPESAVVLALNEVQRVFEHSKIAQDFLPMLRFWHEQAKQDQIWQKLRMVVVHTTEIYVPLKLNQSPFNVGITVTLPPFTLNQVQDLALRYGLEWAADSQGSQRLEPLQAMVGGHPYLVNLALYHLSGEKMTLEMLLETASTPIGIYTQHLRELLNLLQKEPELMSAMQLVITSNEKVELDAIAAYKLESMGLVQLNGNQACVMCELYRLYFSQQLAKHS
ncbi:MAG: AAA-like domain-containing protein [Nostoc sp. ChiSLP01]